jgi:Flp pilus assembly pilin Flp
VNQVISFLAHHPLRAREDGQTLIEYSLVLALIALVAIAGLTAFSLSVDNLYEAVKEASDAMIGSLT